MTTPRARDAAVEGLAEVRALNALLTNLTDDDWERPTASGWTVREVVAHLVGQHVESARPWTIPTKIRQARRAFPGRTTLDAHNALHIAEYGGRTPAELRGVLARFGPKAVRVRRRTPGFIRRRSFARFFPEEQLPDLSFAYLLDVLSNRDTWMHRLEITRAIGRSFATGAHDTGIITLVLADLTRSWTGPPITLILTGSAKISVKLGTADPVAVVRTDTLDYLWQLSGRPGSPALDIDGDTAVSVAVLAARVEF
ncbi:MAG TPA: maleylpyruvate isomerase family mycothiol-dependent enzyme [Pseudonocardiaceae bacterium]|nr:maleylpyruvate isomerase family mycothiol-dependent enzyme [Pseudonocardiaceae bacterium]